MIRVDYYGNIVIFAKDKIQKRDKEEGYGKQINYLLHAVWRFIQG